MPARLFTLPRAVALDANGQPYAGAKANFYLTGTSTPTDTYADALLASANANPVVADANGVFGAIYLDPAVTYKLTLTQSDDTLIYTEDPIGDSVAALMSGVSQKLTSYTIVASDAGKLFTQTAGLCAFTLPSAAAVGAGFRVSFLCIDDVDDGGDITVTRDGSDTITQDGLGTVTTLAIRSGGFATFVCDGSNWFATVVNQSGEFTGSLSGYASPLTPSVMWLKNGGLATVFIEANTTGTSNAATMVLTTLPDEITPTKDVRVPVILQDNGSVSIGEAYIDASDNQITFGLNVGTVGGFTASGTKGFPIGTQITYPLV